MRSGEFVFYVVSATVALTIALQPRIAAVLFVAVTVIALAVALEG